MNNENNKKEKMKKIINKALNVLLVILFIGIILKTIFCVSCVSGESMEPTYHNGDIVIVNRFIHSDDIKRSDVVLFYPDAKYIGKIYIKRIIGIPGDEVQIIDGYLYVNNSKIEDSFGLIENAGIAKDKITLDEDEFFVLGDNRNNSKDSRIIGVVNKSQIIGTVIKKIF